MTLRKKEEEEEEEDERRKKNLLTQATERKRADKEVTKAKRVKVRQRKAQSKV